MEKTTLTNKTTILILVLFLGLFGCEKKFERYEDPVGLGGTNIETLEKEGNYKIFLQLMEKADYKTTVEKQLSTLFVPTDDAFNKYFKEKGISSVNDLSKDQARQLFTCHFIKEPRNANRMIYEKAYDRLESNEGEYRSLFFRKVTSIAPEPVTEIPRYDKTYKGQSILIKQQSKLIPLFSKIYFTDYNGVGQIDYPFMYPNSKWGGLMNYGNAYILPPKGKENTTNLEDLPTTTSSGFIYYVDQVIDIVPNADVFLYQNQDKFGLFYDLMQKFANYAKTSSTDIQGRQMFTKSYRGISNITDEAVSTSSPGNMLNIFTIFLPYDDVLKSYLNEKFATFGGIENIPDVTVQYILQSQITERLELKSKFTKKFHNKFGDVSVISAEDVEPGFMASNAMIYFSKKVMEPKLFLSVPGPLFFNLNYSGFLAMITAAKQVSILSGNKDVTLFAPSNDQLLAANIQVDINSKGDEEIQIKVDGLWRKMTTEQVNEFVSDHIFNGKLTDLSGEGYIEMLSRNYVYYNEESLYSGVNLKQSIPAKITGKEERSNGNLFYVNNAIQSVRRMGEFIMDDPSFSEFAKLMIKTGLLEPNYKDKKLNIFYPNIAFTETAGDFYWTAFIPTNDAIITGITSGNVPDTTISSGDEPTKKAKLDALKRFVNYHFIKNTIFDDGKVSGVFKTLVSGKSLTITNNVKNMTVTDVAGNIVTVNHANANNLVKRGVVHKITTVLKIN